MTLTVGNFDFVRRCGGMLKGPRQKPSSISTQLRAGILDIIVKIKKQIPFFLLVIVLRKFDRKKGNDIYEYCNQVPLNVHWNVPKFRSLIFVIFLNLDGSRGGHPINHRAIFLLSRTWEFVMTLLRSSVRVPMRGTVVDRCDRDYVWKSKLGDITYVIERSPHFLDTLLSEHTFSRL